MPPRLKEIKMFQDYFNNYGVFKKYIQDPIIKSFGLQDWNNDEKMFYNWEQIYNYFFLWNGEKYPRYTFTQLIKLFQAELVDKLPDLYIHQSTLLTEIWMDPLLKKQGFFVSQQRSSKTDSQSQTTQDSTVSLTKKETEYDTPTQFDNKSQKPTDKTIVSHLSGNESTDNSTSNRQGKILTNANITDQAINQDYLGRIIALFDSKFSTYFRKWISHFDFLFRHVNPCDDTAYTWTYTHHDRVPVDSYAFGKWKWGTMSLCDVLEQALLTKGVIDGGLGINVEKTQENTFKVNLNIDDISIKVNTDNQVYTPFYDLSKKTFKEGSNVTLHFDDTKQEVEISSTGGGGGGNTFLPDGTSIIFTDEKKTITAVDLLDNDGKKQEVLQKINFLQNEANQLQEQLNKTTVNLQQKLTDLQTELNKTEQALQTVSSQLDSAFDIDDDFNIKKDTYIQKKLYVSWEPGSYKEIAFNDLTNVTKESWNKLLGIPLMYSTLTNRITFNYDDSYFYGYQLSPNFKKRGNDWISIKQDNILQVDTDLKTAGARGSLYVPKSKLIEGDNIKIDNTDITYKISTTKLFIREYYYSTKNNNMKIDFLPNTDKSLPEIIKLTFNEYPGRLSDLILWSSDYGNTAPFEELLLYSDSDIVGEVDEINGWPDTIHDSSKTETEGNFVFKNKKGQSDMCNVDYYWESKYVFIIKGSYNHGYNNLHWKKDDLISNFRWKTKCIQKADLQDSTQTPITKKEVYTDLKEMLDDNKTPHQHHQTPSNTQQTQQNIPSRRKKWL